MPIRIIKKKKPKDEEKVQEDEIPVELATEQKMMALLSNQRSFRELGADSFNLGDDGDDDDEGLMQFGTGGEGGGGDDGGFTLELEDSDHDDDDGGAGGGGANGTTAAAAGRDAPKRRGVTRSKSADDGNVRTAPSRGGQRRQRIRVNKDTLDKLPDDVRKKLERMKLEAAKQAHRDREGGGGRDAAGTGDHRRARSRGPTARKPGEKRADAVQNNSTHRRVHRQRTRSRHRSEKDGRCTRGDVNKASGHSRTSEVSESDSDDDDESSGAEE